MTEVPPHQLDKSDLERGRKNSDLPPTPSGPYRSVVISNGWIFVSAQPPKRDGVLLAQGRVGHEVSPKTALACVRQSASNVLFQIGQAVGEFSMVRGLVKANVYVLTGSRPVDLDPLVRAVSDVFGQEFGPDQAGAVTAVGVGGLPMEAPVVIDAIAVVSTRA